MLAVFDQSSLHIHTHTIKEYALTHCVFVHPSLFLSVVFRKLTLLYRDVQPERTSPIHLPNSFVSVSVCPSLLLAIVFHTLTLPKCTVITNKPNTFASLFVCPFLFLSIVFRKLTLPRCTIRTNKIDSFASMSVCPLFLPIVFRELTTKMCNQNHEAQFVSLVSP